MAGNRPKQTMVRVGAGMAAAAGFRAVLVWLCALPAVGGTIKTSALLSPPFDDKHDHHGARVIPYWDKSGATTIMKSFVRLTPDKPQQYGTLWTRSSVGSSDFSLEWKFRISGSEKDSYGDTLALIISNSKYKEGRFFGFTETFEGMAVVVNTNRQLLLYDKPGEPTGRHRDVAVVTNNGTRSYDDLIANMEGCKANVRFDESRDDFNVLQSTRIRLKASGNTLAIEVDARNSGRWRRCATIAHTDMPEDWARRSIVGIIARTGEKTNNHDLLGFRLYTDPQEAWEVGTYDDEDEDELDALVHHMEHDLFNVHDSLQETIEQLSDAEEKSKRLAELEASLSKNVMSALEERVARLEAQVQTKEPTTLKKHVNQLHDRLEEGVWDKLSDNVGEMVRGAPLIAVAAVLGLPVEALAESWGEGTAEDASKMLHDKLKYLRMSRPTAMNLSNAVEALKDVIFSEVQRAGSTGSSVIEAFATASEAMLEEDVGANQRQGSFAVEALLEEPSCKEKKRLSVLTHCNTGSLATAGFGTALGVIRTLSERGLLEACFCIETRPYNQGARLTAYEFEAEGFPGRLIADSAVASLMSQGKVDAVAVGADRIAANGDTANKIGTLQLAIAAAHYGVPFLVVAPLTACDPETATGSDIEIEIEGRADSELEIALDDIGAWNPAFDVTPSDLITAIVTDKGVIRPVSQGGGGAKKATFDVKAFVASQAAATTAAG